MYCSHLQRHGAKPSYATVKESREAEGFVFEPTTDALSFVLERFVGQVKYRETILGIEEIGTYLDDSNADLTRLDEMLLEVAQRVARSVPGGGSEKFANMSQRVEQWKADKEKGATGRGIQMGIPQFDALTLGVQQYEFVSIAGWQGTGKSTLMCYCAWHAYLQGFTPLIFSLEMEASAIMRKFDLLALNWQQSREEMVHSLELKGYSMNERQQKRWEEVAERVSKAQTDIIIIDDIGRPTLERLHAEVMKHKPGMATVDYVSLMEPPRVTDSNWQDLTRLTKGLKLMARQTGVPIWGLAQTNIGGAESGAKLENIAYSRSLGQDSDIVLGLHQDETMEANKAMELRLLKNRDGQKMMHTRMLWDPAYARFEEWTEIHSFERDAERAMEEAE
jgi:replicative DNA helicase